MMVMVVYFFVCLFTYLFSLLENNEARVQTQIKWSLIDPILILRRAIDIVNDGCFGSLT